MAQWGGYDEGFNEEYCIGHDFCPYFEPQVLYQSDLVLQMTETKRLLKEGVELADITYQLGFSSQSQFTNFFKKYARVTPKQYSRLYND